MNHSEERLLWATKPFTYRQCLFSAWRIITWKWWFISVLHDKMNAKTSESWVLLCGDYNARTGVRDDIFIDRVPGSDEDLMNLLPNGICIHCNTIDYLRKNGTLKICSQDKMLNNRSKELLDRPLLCLWTGNFKLSARDRSGHWEIHKVWNHGKSVVDYVLCFHGIMDFAIMTKFPESDHLPVTLDI